MLKHVTHSSSSNLQEEPHFTDEESESERDKTTCPSRTPQKAARNPGWLDSRNPAFQLLDLTVLPLGGENANIL